MTVEQLKWPCNRLIYESDGDYSDLCPVCGSSLWYKFKFGWIRLFKTKHCIQPECENSIYKTYKQ